jgi:hypothetical protein
VALQTDYLTNNLTKPRCLGVVLPVSIPQDVVTQTPWWEPFRYPSGGSCTPGVRAFVNPYPVHEIICPDGVLKRISGTCRLPQNTSNGRFDCVVDTTLAPGNTPDPRVFTLMPVDNTGHITNMLDSYSNPNISTTPSLRRFSRAYFRIHMVRPDNSQKQATTTTGCTATDDTSQIGCLVKASPCSIGYAAREAVDATEPFNNVALRIVGVQATQEAIQNLLTGGAPVYPMSRRLWLNSTNNPGDLVGFAVPNLTDAEINLRACMGIPLECVPGSFCLPPSTCDLATGHCTPDTSIIDGAIAAHNFVVVPAGVPRLVLNGMNQGCPLP